MPLYVNMTDKSQKRPGGRTHLSILCDTREQAENIEALAHMRPQMTRISLSRSARLELGGDVTRVMHVTELSPTWFRFFTREQMAEIESRRKAISATVTGANVP